LIAACLRGNHFYIDSDYNRVATEFSVLARTRIVRRGLGQEPQQAQKNTRFPEKENRWFCQSGYQVALLAGLLFMPLGLAVLLFFIRGLF